MLKFFYDLYFRIMIFTLLISFPVIHLNSAVSFDRVRINFAKYLHRPNNLNTPCLSVGLFICNTASICFCCGLIFSLDRCPINFSTLIVGIESFFGLVGLYRYLPYSTITIKTKKWTYAIFKYIIINRRYRLIFVKEKHI